MSEVSRCFACGAFVQKDDRFCWSCGRDLTVIAKQPTLLKSARRLEEELSREEWLQLRRAYLMQSRGQVEEAEKLVLQVLAVRPQHVPSLTLLAELQHARGDLIGAVETARLASEVAAEMGDAPPGALRRAREERAEIEQRVIQDVIGADGKDTLDPISVFITSAPAWYRRGWFFTILAGLGALCFFLALIHALRGHALGYGWIGGSLLAAGWVYQDAESSRRMGLVWGPLVLLLGPGGLTIYLLSR